MRYQHIQFLLPLLLHFLRVGAVHGKSVFVDLGDAPVPQHIQVAQHLGFRQIGDEILL